GYAARLAMPGSDARPVAAFVFDMIGDKDLEIYPEIQSAQRAANLCAIVWDAARATGARGFRERPRYAITDDHIPLLEAGLPTVATRAFVSPPGPRPGARPDQPPAQGLAGGARVAAWIVYKSPLARR